MSQNWKHGPKKRSTYGIWYNFKTFVFSPRLKLIFARARSVLTWTPGFRQTGPLPPYLSFKFIGLFKRTASYQEPQSRLASPLLFVPHPSWLSPMVCILTFSNTGHSHRMCTNISFSAPYPLYKGVFALLILCSMVLQIDMLG